MDSTDMLHRLIEIELREREQREAERIREKQRELRKLTNERRRRLAKYTARNPPTRFP